jgi:hypothetical protein
VESSFLRLLPMWRWRRAILEICWRGAKPLHSCIKKFLKVVSGFGTSMYAQDEGTQKSRLGDV